MTAATRPVEISDSLRRFAFAVAAVAASPFRALGKAMRNRMAIRQLIEADDHMLRDIGLTRSDVTTALRTPLLTDPCAKLPAFQER